MKNGTSLRIASILAKNVAPFKVGSSRGAASGRSDFVISENCPDFKELSAGCTFFLKQFFFLFAGAGYAGYGYVGEGGGGGRGRVTGVIVFGIKGRPLGKDFQDMGTWLL